MKRSLPSPPFLTLLRALPLCLALRPHPHPYLVLISDAHRSRREAHEKRSLPFILPKF